MFINYQAIALTFNLKHPECDDPCFYLGYTMYIIMYVCKDRRTYYQTICINFIIFGITLKINNKLMISWIVSKCMFCITKRLILISLNVLVKL